MEFKKFQFAAFGMVVLVFLNIEGLFHKRTAVYMYHYVRMSGMISFLASYFKNTYSSNSEMRGIKKSCKIKNVPLLKVQLYISNIMSVCLS